MGTKYSSNASSGYNATPPADDGTVSEANKVKWSTIKTKLVDPVKDLADTINSELATHFNNGPNAYTANQTLGLTNYNQVNQVSGSGVTLTLTDAATLGAGWYTDIVSTDTTNSVTLARATASNTINGVSSDVTILPLHDLRVIVNAAATGFLAKQHPYTYSDTWTPTLFGATTTTYTTQTGNYVRIGNVVNISMHLTINSIGNGSTYIITGLPFTVGTFGTMAVHWTSAVSTFVHIVGFAEPASTKIYLYSAATAANATSANSVIGNGTTIKLSGTYYV